MLSNRLAFAALAVACIAAAAGGGYLASRQNVAPAPVAASTPTAAPVPAAVPAEHPVESTEAVVSQPKPTAAEPTAPVARREPAPRVTPAPVPPGRKTTTAARPVRESASAAPPATPLPTLERTWPGSGTMPAPPPPIEAAAAAPAPDPADAADPSGAQYEELVVAADSVIGLQTSTPISTETARVEDRVEARVTRDVRVGSQVAIPAGSEAIGSVTLVERGGKFKERSRLGIRFHTLVLADGTRLPISTETIYREGEGPGDAAASRIGGGAVGGAILGAILGGARGAVIGATTGAGAGTAMVAAGDRHAATLPAGSPMTVRLIAPVSVAIDK